MRPSRYQLKEAARNWYRLPLFELTRINSAFIRFIPFRPIEGVLYLTENCNARCVTCSFWQRKSEHELTTSEVADALRQLKQSGVSYLCLSGGEPLLRQDLGQIVRSAAGYRFEKIQLITNGLLLTEQLAETLCAGGLNKITLSLNGSRDTHDTSRGVMGSYDRCLNALGYLAELRDTEFPGLEITVNMILMKPSLHEVPHVLDLCREFSVALALTPIDNRSFYENPDVSELVIRDQSKLDEVVNSLHRVARDFPALINGTHVSLEYLRHYFDDPVRRDIPCYLGHLSINIGAHGEVYTGCEVLPPVGNLREESLSTIVKSAKYRQRLARMFAKQCPGCVCGYGCNLYAHLPSILEEILWTCRIRNPQSGGPEACALDASDAAHRGGRQRPVEEAELR